ncbi:TraR/DksA C4-type zinc finger protein [Planococcus sp. APC 4015]|nr:TraR/DksA C4-type zinc finger protein [Planococcus sp. APC 4015]
MSPDEPAAREQRATPDHGRSSLNALRADLVGRIHRLDLTIATLRADRGAETADDEHDPEGATLSHEWSRLAGLRADAERELDETDAAIAGYVDGTYGVCTDCGEPIPAARLVARPTATRCVACAAKAGL